jgi:hypothetical protein
MAGGAAPALAQIGIDRGKAKQNVTAMSVFLFMAQKPFGSYTQALGRSR